MTLINTFLKFHRSEEYDLSFEQIVNCLIVTIFLGLCLSFILLKVMLFFGIIQVDPNLLLGGFLYQYSFYNIWVYGISASVAPICFWLIYHGHFEKYIVWHNLKYTSYLVPLVILLFSLITNSYFTQKVWYDRESIFYYMFVMLPLIYILARLFGKPISKEMEKVSSKAYVRCFNLFTAITATYFINKFSLSYLDVVVLN